MYARREEQRREKEGLRTEIRVQGGEKRTREVTGGMAG